VKANSTQRSGHAAQDMARHIESTTVKPMIMNTDQRRFQRTRKVLGPMGLSMDASSFTSG
jgi:hypothetical protein